MQLRFVFAMLGACAAWGAASVGRAAPATQNPPTAGPAASPAADAALKAWIMQQIGTDTVVDIAKYGPACAPGKRQHLKSWADYKCKLPAAFVHDLLLNPKAVAALPQHGLRLSHAFLTGSLDLSQLDLVPQIWIQDSVIEGNVDVTDSHLHRTFSLGGTIVTGKLTGERVVADSTIFIRNEALVYGGVDFASAVVHGDLDLVTAIVFDDIEGSNIRIDGDLMLQDVDGGHSFVSGDVNFPAALIAGRLILNNQDIERKPDKKSGGSIYLDDIVVKSVLEANELVVRNKISAISARIDGNVLLNKAAVDGTFDGAAMSVGRAIYARGAKFGGELDLSDARLDLGLLLNYATLSQLDLTDADIEELMLDGVKWVCPAEMPAAPAPAATAAAGGKVKPHGQPAPPASPAPAPVPRSWPLGDGSWRKVTCNGKSTPDSLPLMRMRNTSIGAFPSHPMSWPVVLSTRGLHYSRLGGFISKQEVGNQRETTRKEWLDWLARDRDFNSQPYVQLASVLQAEGQKDTGEAVLYRARMIERAEAWNALTSRLHTMFAKSDAGSEARQNTERRVKGAPIFAIVFRWVFLALGAWIGYGIGGYSFLALVPLSALTAIGTVTLYFSPRLRAYPIRSTSGAMSSLAVGLAWRVGASFQKVLPLIEYYKPFKDFLDNPEPDHLKDAEGNDLPAREPRNLARWQVLVFSAMSLVGWVLGGFVAAAVGGLTQKG